jgi:6-phosphogluconate dehydrogenase
MGNMGGQLALHAVDKGYEVVGYDNNGLDPDFKEKGVLEAGDIKELAQKLNGTKIIFLYIPARPIIDEVVNELSEYLGEGDIIIDGGNSYWGDSKIRHK